MKSALFFLFAVTAFASTASTASAGIFTDDLTRCLVRSSTTEDKSKLVRWVFSALAANPNVASIAKVSDAESQDMTRDAAHLFERLVLVDCRKESVEAIKNEGPDALNQSFQVLGEAASRELMSHPDVVAKFEGLSAYTDETKWAALVAETTGEAAPAK